MEISQFDLVHSLSDAIDLINPKLMSHHKRVAYIACSIGGKIGLTPDQGRQLFISSLLHDIGAIASTFEENQELEQFEVINPHKHAILGYLLINSYVPFEAISEIIKYHHAPWNNGSGRFFRGQDIPVESYIIHLADRADILVKRSSNVLDQVDRVRDKIKSAASSVFMPELVDSFLEISNKESFWLDLTSPYLSEILKKKTELPTIETNIDNLRDIARLFSHIIDFRSGFTASHSSGVAACAERLAELINLPETDSQLVGVAGYLHDIGKLVVPNSILNKPEPLSSEEFNVIKRHSYYTKQILGRIPVFDKISQWASSHHERLDGTGYPFRQSQDELDVGSRILAVADIFTALTEDRPYRAGMRSKQVKDTMLGNVRDGHADGEVVDLLMDHYEEVNQLRIAAQQNGNDIYRRFWDQANLEMAAATERQFSPTKS